MSLRLFISHSTALQLLEEKVEERRKANPNLAQDDVNEIICREIESDVNLKEGVDKLYDLLKEGGYDPLIDYKNLGPGEWQPQLYAWIGRCEGAIILFSKRALKSVWVPREASLLMYRQSLDPDFEVIPVAVEGAKMEDFETGHFKQLSLSGLMWSKGSTPEAIVDSVQKSEKLKQAAGTTPLDQVTKMVADRLQKHVLPERVREQAELMKIELGPWDPKNDEYRRLAVRLLQKPFQEAGAVLQQLAQFGGDIEPFQECADFLKPLLADGDATTRLARIYSLPIKAAQAEARRAAALNATENDVAKLYVKRAYWDSYLFVRFAEPTLEIEGGTDLEKDFKNLVDQLLAEAVDKLSPSFKGNPEKLAKLLKTKDPEKQLKALLQREARKKKGKRQLYVLWRCERNISPKLFAKAQTSFPWLRFFLISGEPEGREWIQSLQSESYENLEPQLEDDQESDIVFDLSEAESWFG